MKRVLPVLVILSLLFVIEGCKKAPTTANKPPKPDKQQVAKALQAPMSSVKVAQQPEQIDFSRKKDPFRPYAIVVTPQKTQKATRSTAGLLPIHQYELSQFKVIGIITGFKENRAMIVDPAGKSYVVKVGMTVGLNEGRISRINPSSIEVVESIVDDSGKRVSNKVVLNLPRKQEFSR